MGLFSSPINNRLLVLELLTLVQSLPQAELIYTVLFLFSDLLFAGQLPIGLPPRTHRPQVKAQARLLAALLVCSSPSCQP